MIRELLKSNNTKATPVVLFLVDRLGSSVFSYEPETIAEYLKNIESSISDSLLNKVNAALGLFTSDLFWTDPITFSLVCRALNGKIIDAGEEPTLADIVWGVTEANLLFGDVSGDIQFSENVKTFVQFLFKANGIYSMPTSLRSSFGDIPSTMAIDDPQMAQARQEESDSAAAELDQAAQAKLLDMLRQILSVGVKLQESAIQEIKQVLSNTGGVE